MCKNHSNKIKQLEFIIATFLIVACSNNAGGGSNPPVVTPLNLGTLPNGSSVWASSGTFTSTSGGYTTGSISLAGGTSGASYMISYSVDPIGPSVTSNPNPCVLVSGSGNACQMILNSESTASGNYQVTVYYTANLTQAHKAQATDVATPLPNKITFVVSACPTPTISPSPTVTPTTTPSPTPTVSPTSSPTPAPSPTPNGNLVISALGESSIKVGESTALTVTLSNSIGITTPITVSLTSSNPTAMSESPTSCSLTTIDNYCTVKLIGESGGIATLTAAATGYTSVTSAPLSIGQFIFVTSLTYNGDLQHGGGVITVSADNGVHGADAICESEATAASLPGTFKALLVSSTRYPCDANGVCGEGITGGAADWPVAANTTYYTPYGSATFSADIHGIFESNYTAGSIYSALGESTHTYVWSGVNGVLTSPANESGHPTTFLGWSYSQVNSWPGNGWNPFVNYTCSDWNTSLSTTLGTIGDSGFIPDNLFTLQYLVPNRGYSTYNVGNSGSSQTFATRWITGGRNYCNRPSNLICIQQ